MDIQIYIIIALSIVLVCLGIWMVILWRKNKNHKSSVPQSIIDEFNELEEIYAKNNGQKSHQEILWEYYKKNHMNKLHPTSVEDKSINNLGTIQTKQTVPPKLKPRLDINKLFRR